jgi:hypothetical protein
MSWSQFILFLSVIVMITSAADNFDVAELMMTGIPVEGQSLDVGAAIPTIPHKSGLSPDCNNKICLMMEYALSCKTFNLGIKKICANYLVGYLYGCSDFPSASQIYNAPSVCLTEYITFAKTIAANPQAAIGGLIGDHLNLSTYDTNTCKRQCFQNFQYASNDFYLSCASELKNATVAAVYPIASLLSIYQPFRDQACTYNNESGVSPATCYEELGVIMDKSSPATNPSPAPTFMPTLADGASFAPTQTPPNDFYDFNCTYNTFALPPAYQEAYDTNVKKQFCALFSATGCCTANILGMLQQSPVPPTQPKLLPPCFLSYLNGYCPGVNLTTFCRTGATADLSTFTATIQIPNCPTCPTASGGQLKAFPNMYLQSSVLTLMGVVAAAFGSTNATFTIEPYKLSPSLPFNVEIIDFVYYDSAGVRLTPDDGTVAQPSWSDYEGAAYGVFTFQPVLNNVNSAQISSLYNAVLNPYFAGTFSKAYAGGQNLGIPFQATRGPAPSTYVADPLNLETSGTTRGVSGVLPVWLLATLMVVAASYGVAR